MLSNLLTMLSNLLTTRILAAAQAQRRPPIETPSRWTVGGVGSAETEPKFKGKQQAKIFGHLSGIRDLPFPFPETRARLKRLPAAGARRAGRQARSSQRSADSQAGRRRAHAYARFKDRQTGKRSFFRLHVVLRRDPCWAHGQEQPWPSILASCKVDM